MFFNHYVCRRHVCVQYTDKIHAIDLSKLEKLLFLCGLKVEACYHGYHHKEKSQSLRYLIPEKITFRELLTSFIEQIYKIIRL